MNNTHKSSTLGAGGGQNRKRKILTGENVQVSHQFPRSNVESVEDAVPIFRGIKELPYHAVIFTTRDYYEQAVDNKEYLQNRFEENRKEALKREQRKRDEPIKTPLPAEKHTFCQVCKRHYHEGKYKEHIRSAEHA